MRVLAVGSSVAFDASIHSRDDGMTRVYKVPHPRHLCATETAATPCKQLNLPPGYKTCSVGISIGAASSSFLASCFFSSSPSLGLALSSAPAAIFSLSKAAWAAASSGATDAGSAAATTTAGAAGCVVSFSSVVLASSSIITGGAAAAASSLVVERVGAIVPFRFWRLLQ